MCQLLENLITDKTPLRHPNLDHLLRLLLDAYIEMRDPIWETEFHIGQQCKILETMARLIIDIDLPDPSLTISSLYHQAHQHRLDADTAKRQGRSVESDILNAMAYATELAGNQLYVATRS